MRLAERAEMSEHLQQALVFRAVIDQAIGIIMAQNRCPATNAFELLRSVSQNRNIKLRDVAAQIVTSVGGEQPTDTARFS